MKTKSEVVGVRITAALKQRLERAATSSGRDGSFIVRFALSEMFKAKLTPEEIFRAHIRFHQEESGK